MAGLVDSIADIVTPRPTALIPVANGTEEIELAGLSDVLSRGGVRVTIACVDGDKDHVVNLSKGMVIQADQTIQSCMEEQFDLIVIPGGPGSTVLGHCSILGDMLYKQRHAGRLYGGICAGVVDVLYHHALVTGPMTTYPAYANNVGDLYRDAAVVVAGNCVTSQGPATAIPMGIKLIELLRGEKVAHDVARDLVYPY